MCAGGRLRAIFALVLLLWCEALQGTQLAPASPTSEKPCEVHPSKQLISGAKEEVEGNSTTAGESPRFYSPSSHPCDGNYDRLELPLHSTRCPQRAQQELLQQLRLPLGDCEMVASSTGEESFTKPKEERPRKEEDRAERIWTGEGTHHRHLGAIWNWRSSSESMGGNHSYQNGDGPSTGSPKSGRDGGSTNHSSRGENRGYRQVGSVEEDAGCQRSRRQGDPGPTQCTGNSTAQCQRWFATSDHPQDLESIAESGEAVCSRHNAIARARRTVEEVEPVYAAKIYGTGEALQREEKSCNGQDQRAGRTPSDPTSRDATSSTAAGRSSESRRILARARSAAFPGDRYDSLQQRRRGQEATSQGCSNLGELSGEATTENMNPHHVRFDDTVAIKIYGSSDNQNCYEFTCSMDSLERWDSKPWALYEGNFVNKAQQLLAKVCQVSRDYFQRDRGRGVLPLWDDEGEQRCDDGLLHCGVCSDQDGQQGALLQGEGEREEHDRALFGGGAGRDPHALGDGEQLHQCGAHREWGSHEGTLRDDGRGAQGHEAVENALDEDQTNGESQKPGMIHLFGVDGAYLGQRNHYQKQFDFGHSAVRTAIQKTWSDHYGESTTYHVPRPQPMPEPGDPDVEHLFILVDFLPLEDPMHFGKVAVLADIKGWNEEDIPIRRMEGTMLPERATWLDIVRVLALQDHCVHRVGNQCIIRLQTGLILNDEPYVLPDDGLISINYDIWPDMLERVSLLQCNKQGLQHGGSVDEPGPTEFEGGRPPTSSGSNDPIPGSHSQGGVAEAFRNIQQVRFHDDVELMTEVSGQYAHLFHRTKDYAHALLDADNPFEERRQIARIWNVNEREIIALHPVLFPPDDLRGRVLITRWHSDDRYKVYDTDVQALFDLELHSGDTQSPNLKLFRHVEWTRTAMTRDNILSSAYVDGYCCLIARDTCLVWHNRRLWPLQEVEPRELRAGDSIRIAIPAQTGKSAEDLRSLLRHAEVCANNHVHYQAHTDDDTTEEEEEEESEQTRYGRSPTVSEPEPLELSVCPEAYDTLVRSLADWSGDQFNIHLYFLYGAHQQTYIGQLPQPFKWSNLTELLRQLLGDLIHHNIAIHPILDGMERRMRHCRIVVEISHIAVCPLRTQRRPALVCKAEGGRQNKDRWQAVYVPTQPSQVDHWAKAKSFWLSGNPSSALLCTYEGGSQQLRKLHGYLTEVVATQVTVHCHLVPTDGRPAGRRTGTFHRWHIDDECAFQQACYQLWPEATHWTLVLPNDGAFDVCKEGINVILHPPEQTYGRIFWCSLQLQGPEQAHSQIDFAVGIDWPCHLCDLQAHLGLDGTPIGTLFTENQPLPAGLCDGDHLRLCGALRPVGHQKAAVPHAIVERTELPADWHTIGPMKRPRSEAICLHAAIDGNHYKPPPVVIENDQPNDDGINFREVLALWDWLDASMPEVSWLLPDGAHWHSQSLPWTTAAWWDLMQADEIAIYTDGSATKGSASAAAIFFVYSRGHWFYAGYLKQDLLGKPCAHRAELCGILLAYHYLNSTLRRLAHLQAAPPKVHLLFDATSAGYKAAGFWKGDTYNHLTQALRSLEYFLDVRFQVSVEFAHVRGHTGDPGNEAANTIANIRNQDKQYCMSVWCAAFDNSVPEEIQWLWALWKPEWQGLWRAGNLYCPTSPSTQAHPDILRKQNGQTTMHPEDPAPTVQKYEMNIVSANVLSLLPKGGPAGIQGKARMEMLQAQFADKNYHIIGLQETRVRAEIKVDQKDYLVFGAPATAGGHYGCQIWISSTIPLGTNGDCLRKQHCKIVAKDPRFLIIQIKAPFLNTLVISAHAPTSQASLETITKWWETLDAHIPPKLRQWPQLLLVDANARIGSQPSPAVGPHQADEQDAGGEEFHGYLLSHHLWVPATFASHHEGDAGTWKHPRTDDWSRGDYVCLPRQWILQECRSYIDKEVDISLTREDHRPPAVVMVWTDVASAERRQTRRSSRYDVAALRHDLVGENSAVIINSLQQDLRSVPWGFDVHTHTEILQQSLQQWMTKWYSQRRKHPRRPHMSSATWDLVIE